MSPDTGADIPAAQCVQVDRALFVLRRLICSSQRPWHVISSFQTRTVQASGATWPAQDPTAYRDPGELKPRLHQALERGWAAAESTQPSGGERKAGPVFRRPESWSRSPSTCEPASPSGRGFLLCHLSLFIQCQVTKYALRGWALGYRQERGRALALQAYKQAIRRWGPT